MAGLGELIQRGTPVAQHHPWPRVVVAADDWARAAEGLAADEWSLLGLWGAPGWVHMALLEEASATIGMLSHACPEGRYRSVAELHPPAMRLERTLRDLFALEPEGLPDTRPWLDHGQWGVRFTRAGAVVAPVAEQDYAFLPSEGESLHRIPVGPVHAGIIEPGHFRFTANGEAVVRLEQRLGYVHKGIDVLLAGSDLARGAELAGRVSGDSTVAYALAFARAAEAALQVAPPPRAVWLRALMAELERVANHLGDIGAICNDASFAIMLAHCGALRERVLRAADTAFGHRMMRDRIVPGGVASDLRPEGAAAIRAVPAEIHVNFPGLVELYDKTASLQDRTVSTGILTTGLARQFAPGGFIGRASGRSFDVRRSLAYPPYNALQFDVPTREDGDVNARVWIRIREVEQSLTLIAQILDRLPDGQVQVALSPAGASREGMAIVEGFRGDVLAWLQLDADGRITRCHLRDPSWFQWPLLEAVIEGNIVADFPLCNKSFNCSYSGHDL